MLRKIFSAKVVAAEATLLLVVMLASLGMLVSPTAACIATGSICILAGVFCRLYTGSDFVNRNLGWLVIASCALAAVAAMAGGIFSGQIVYGVISAIAALLIVLAIVVLKKLWAHLVLAVISIVAMVMMVMPAYAVEPAAVEEESDEDDSEAEEASEIESLRADLEEALQANEELRRLYEEHVARCKDCPICNGEMTVNELKGRKTDTNVKRTSNGIAYVGKALGDGQGNGAGVTPVTPVYDPNVPAPGSNEAVKVIAPKKTVDFTDDSDDKDVDVDDRHEGTPSAGDDSDNKPVVEEDKTEKTQELTYSVAGNIITVKAAQGFTAVSDILSYIVAKGDVTVVNASAEANVLTITFEASEDAKIVVCKGMFKNGDVKSAELEVSVKRTSSKVEEEKPSQDDDSNKTEEEEKPVDQPKEMQVQSIDVQTICDKAYAGDSLQYVVTANGQNIDYSKIAVSMGSIAADGTWTIIAPAESGSATVSFGNVSKTVSFEVTVDASSNDVPPTQETPSDDPTEEPEQPVENPSEEEEPSEEPVEMGTLTSISMYDSSVVCESSIQGEIACEGNVNWDEVEVSGLNGLGCEISDGVITIHTSEVASSYEITVSYNGSSVSASFDVEGVEDADIAWD